MCLCIIALYKSTFTYLLNYSADVAHQRTLLTDTTDYKTSTACRELAREFITRSVDQLETALRRTR